MISSRKLALIAVTFALVQPLASAQTSWTVRRDWVQAHEQFLSSDVMAGRGSATRDEEIAATYVASEFLAYGLKTAPGLSGYIQSAELESPVLDGHASFTVGGLTLHEGEDFRLLTSTGHDASGPLQHDPAQARGAVLLLGVPAAGASSMQLAQRARRSGAAILVAVDDASAQQASVQMGGKTRTPIQLKGAATGGGRGSIMLVSAATMQQLLTQGDAAASLTVHVLPVATPRRTFNAVGYLPGSDSAAGTILLTAHLDHLGIGTPVNGDAIYNGANDDAAGTTAVLELAHALAAGPQLKRSILFVCYGSEEAGELGSEYFGQHSPVPLNDLIANLEFEMIGNQDPKMPKGVLLLTGWDRSDLGPALKAHGALLGPDPYPEEHFFERSDNYQLALQGVVAHTAAGWGTPPTYHQPNDDMAHLNLDFMTSAIQSLVEPMRWLASTGFKPAWNPGGQPKR